MKENTDKKETKEIHIILTMDEYKKLKDQQKFLELPTYAALIRMYINYGICYRIDYTKIHEVATQISRIGNNINQIALVANQSKDVSDRNLCDVLFMQEKIVNLLDENVMSRTKLHRYLEDISER